MRRSSALDKVAAVYCFAIGPGSTESIGTTWETLDVSVIGAQSGGFVEGTAGEIAVPVSGVYELTASADGVKSAAGATTFDLRIQTDASGSFAAATGMTANGTSNGSSNGGQVVAHGIVVLAAGDSVRVQAQAASALDVVAGSYRLTIRRIG